MKQLRQTEHQMNGNNIKRLATVMSFNAFYTHTTNAYRWLSFIAANVAARKKHSSCNTLNIGISVCAAVCATGFFSTLAHSEWGFMGTFMHHFCGNKNATLINDRHRFTGSIDHISLNFFLFLQRISYFQFAIDIIVVRREFVNWKSF